LATEVGVDVTRLEFSPEMARQCRTAGRNAPCPHGSGRKVKFCPCPVLHPAQADAQAVPWEVEKTVGEDMAVFMLAPRFADTLPAAWTRFTDGEAWPGSLQNLFTTRDQFTVARFVDWFLRAYPLSRYNDRTPASLFAAERADRIGPTGRRAAAAYAASTPALVRVEEYTANERMTVTNLLTGERVEALLTADMQMPDEIGVGWVLWSFMHTLNDTARVSPAAVALPATNEAEMLAAVREAVGENPTQATLREVYPALVRRGDALRKQHDDAEKTQWVHAIYTAPDEAAAVAVLREDETFAPYSGKETFPRAGVAFDWTLPEGEEGERFVAVAANRVVLAASSPEVLAEGRVELTAVLRGVATFLTESDEPAATLLRRSWTPGAVGTRPEDTRQSAVGGEDNGAEIPAVATGEVEDPDAPDAGAVASTQPSATDDASEIPAVAVGETEDPDADSDPMPQVPR